MTSRDRAELRLLRWYAIGSGTVLLALTASAFSSQPTRFTELTVERLNIVEPGGRTRLVLTSAERSPGIVERGDTVRAGGGRVGMLFYNDEGTESGGLIFSGKSENGVVNASGSLTFDQYETDQAVALQYVDAGGTRRAGLGISDYPRIPTSEMIARTRRVSAMPDGADKQAARALLASQRGKLRFYAGRSRDDGAAIVSLADAMGRTRLQLRVDSLGDARIEFLDQNGRTVRHIPE